MARRTRRLSDVQIEMLRFFAGTSDIPGGHARTTSALRNRELIAWNKDSNRYRITELGQRVVSELEAKHIPDSR